MAYSNQAQLDMLAYRTAAAMGWAGRAIELARRLDDQETLSHALTNIGSARLNGGDLGGRVELERGFEVAVAAGLEDHAARALSNLATQSVEMRDYRHARGTWTGRSPSCGRTSWPGTRSTCWGTALACGWTRGTGPARSRTRTRRWPSR